MLQSLWGEILIVLDSLWEWVEYEGNMMRSVTILVVGMLLFSLPTNIYKLHLYTRAILYFVICWDKSWKKPQDPGSIFGPHVSRGLPLDRKTIYFVRHGESTWNDTFNKGPHRSLAFFVIGFIPGIIKALLYETYLVLSGKLDSWFYDSPLSYLGISQADELASFLVDKPLDGPDGKDIQILRGDPGMPESKLLSSNLRRCVGTMAIAFRDRLHRRPDDKILVHGTLQEISRNPDTLSITPPYTHIQASWVENRNKSLCNVQEIYSAQVDMSLHAGNKPLSTNGLLRMFDFCEFIFSTDCVEDYVIVGGHSIWFRSFFQMFLPFSVSHVCKKAKIVNGGVVKFELVRAETKHGYKYMVDPKSIMPIYAGWST